MSKGEGRFVTIKFTEPITSIPNVMLQVREERQDLNYTAVGTYSSNIIDRAFDGNTGTFWESRSTGNYIQIDLAQSARFVHGFKVYSGASYRPSNYTLSVSDDGVTYTTIKTDTIPALTGWHELLLDVPVKARFVRVNFGYSSRLYLYEFVLLVGDKICGFTVTGEQYKYIHGPLLDMKYVIEDVILHPTIDKAIRIEFNDLGRFATVNGNLTVNYDSSIGNLVGQGGAVESFTREFLPTELVATPNPNAEENISVAPFEIVAELKDIEYPKGYSEQGNISVAPFEVTATLINVEDINP